MTTERYVAYYFDGTVEGTEPVERSFTLDGQTPEERREEAIEAYLGDVTEGGTSFSLTIPELQPIEIARVIVEDVVQGGGNDMTMVKGYKMREDHWRAQEEKSERETAYAQYLWLKNRFEKEMTATEHDAFLEKNFKQPLRASVRAEVQNSEIQARLEICKTLKDKKNTYVGNLKFSDAFSNGYQQGLAEAREVIELSRFEAHPHPTEPANAIYQAVIKYLEELEHKRVYTGNGHHLAQKVTEMAVQGLRDRNLLP